MEGLVKPIRTTAPFDVVVFGVEDQAEYWLRFDAGHGSRALVAVVFDDKTYRVAVLHWIESMKAGDGTRLLKSIAAWAEEEHFDMSLLVTDPDLIGWYQHNGWTIHGQAFGGVEMIRLCSPANP